MKKIKIEGELKDEIQKQVEIVSAIHSEIEALSKTKYEHEKKMWKHLKKEFPDQSENCTISIEGDDVIFIDRLKD